MQQDRPLYVINRPAYSLPEFDGEFDKKKRTFPIGEKVKKCFRFKICSKKKKLCSGSRLKSLLFRHLPILSWLPKYKVKESLLYDVISGVSAGTIQVPQGMAFALLADLPPVNGLYSSFFPLIPYFFMGTVHQMVPGTFAVLSIMVGIECLKLAPESHFMYHNATLNETQLDTIAMNEARLGVSATLACLTAIIQMGLGLMQFGFVAIYLSESFVRGFMTAAGLQILISVLKYIFGINVPPYSGPLATVYTLKDIVYGLPDTNLASLVFALVSIVVLITVKELGAHYRHKLPFPIPVEIIVVVVATALSGPLDLPEKYHMNVVGTIPLGFPAPVLPTVSQWSEMLGTAFSLAIVGYVINLAMGRTLAAKHGYDVDPNQEMLALGFSNFLGSFFKIHVICCALSVTLAVDSAGGTSQFASLCVMLVVMVTMLAFAVFLKPLPKSVLGALIAVNLKNTLLQLADPYYLWKKSKLDCVKSVEGVKIVTYCAPLYFANAEIFRRKVIKKTGLDPGKLLLARKTFLKKQQKELEGQMKQSKKRMSTSLSQHQLQNDFNPDNGNPYPPPSPQSYVNFHCSDIELGNQSPDPDQPGSSPVTLDSQPMPFHTLILDLAGVCFIDLMGIKVLTKMNSNYDMLGIKLYLANVQAQVYEELEGGGVFEEGSIAQGHLFLSVHDAILCAQQRSRNTGGSEKSLPDGQEKFPNFLEEEKRDLEQELF
ncbi:hypothetical protein DPEC_G00011960 [Dallia pectoralis]|uniref:Uncharacterized protein n=1 Tax=Dallia pectoralis TaxID=75939 RepID=A0ACC2HM47_DALPE|nr:hypothetical protein DPEC_G00011960 [Dallia pectoralis]